MNERSKEVRLLQKASDAINKNLAAELVAQGHSLTGSLERSIHGNVIQAGNGVAILGTMNSYGKYVETGVGKDKIPYGGHSASGGTSKYIQGLITFWKLKGLGEKEAIRAAFATAKKHKKEGMPTKGSQAFSKTGERTKFIRIVERATGDEIDTMVSSGLDMIVDQKYREVKSETI